MRTLQFGIAALAAGLGVVAFSTACEQPTLRCTITTNQFVAKFTKTAGPDSCDEVKFERFRASPYYDVEKKNPAFENQPNVNDISVAIKPVAVGSLLDRADLAVAAGAPAYDESKTYSFTKWPELRPDANGFCRIPAFDQPLDVTLPPLAEVPAEGKTPGAPAQPQTRYQYEFTDFQVYVTPTAAGVTFKSKLRRTITKGTDQPQVCEFDVLAIAPVVACGGDDDKPNDKVCEARPDPDAGLPAGSGLNPDFKVRCDPDILFCFPAEAKFPPLL